MLNESESKEQLQQASQRGTRREN